MKRLFHSLTWMFHIFKNQKAPICLAVFDDVMKSTSQQIDFIKIPILRESNEGIDLILFVYGKKIKEISRIINRELISEYKCKHKLSLVKLQSIGWFHRIIIFQPVIVDFLILLDEF